MYMVFLHILLLTVYSTLSMLLSANEIQNISFEQYIIKTYREKTAITFFSGLLDLFVSCMAWFITDEDYNPKIIRDPNTGEVYQVQQVVKKHDSI